MVNESANCNYSQLVSREDGSTVVSTYDWTSFFATRFRKDIGIKQLHHFRFDSAEPGKMHIKEHVDTADQTLDLLKAPWSPDVSELPDIITPQGLSAERQWYLYEQIRPFCPDEDMDSTCPLPTVPKSSSRHNTPCPEETTTQPPAKRKRQCGTCRQEGHNSRSCPNKEI